MKRARLINEERGLATRHIDWERGDDRIFGSIGGMRVPIPIDKDFIPLDDQGRILDVADGNVNPQWLGLSTRPMQFRAYQLCAPLAGVIDRLAEADTNGRIEVVNLLGETVKNANKIPQLQRLIKLLKRPNPLQTWEEFNSQQVVLSKIFGFCPVFCISPFGMDKSHTYMMWNLNPYYLLPELNFEFSFRDENTIGPIKSWSFSLFGESYEIPAKDIMLVKDGFIDSQIPANGLPVSKVAGLDFYISNIIASQEADNVLLKKKGPLGVFSHNARPDMAGQLPMLKEDKDQLQEDLSRYGLSWNKLQYVISKNPVSWQPMSFNLRDLMTKETARAGIDAICDRFGYPAELMSGKNATYENRNSAEKYLYQNNIIPFSLRTMARYDSYFGLLETNYRLIKDYDHLPVLQEDIMHAGQAAEALSKGLTLDWQNGIITWNEYRIAKVMDALDTEEGNWYYPQWFQKYGKLLNNGKKADTSSKNS